MAGTSLARGVVTSHYAIPPALQPGDLVAVVAPSGAVPGGHWLASEFWRGLAWVRDRYRLWTSAAVLSRAGYLAGSDEDRAAHLARAMTHRDVKAILAARGGYGAMRLLEREGACALPWSAFEAAPKWVVGFSDITALHVELAARGIASIHGPHVTGLGREPIPWMRARWLAALERPHAPHEWCNLQVIRTGVADGTAFGGNLALLEAMASAARLHLPQDAILMLEDVTERPYRIDRMLTSLRLSGALARVRGIVLGEFAQCDPGPDGVLAADVLAERTRDLGVPVVAGAPFGHGTRNDAFILGSRVRIDARTGGGRVSFAP